MLWFPHARSEQVLKPSCVTPRAAVLGGTEAQPFAFGTPPGALQKRHKPTRKHASGISKPRKNPQYLQKKVLGPLFVPQKPFLGGTWTLCKLKDLKNGANLGPRARPGSAPPGTGPRPRAPPRRKHHSRRHPKWAWLKKTGRPKKGEKRRRRRKKRRKKKEEDDISFCWCPN